MAVAARARAAPARPRPRSRPRPRPVAGTRARRAAPRAASATPARLVPIAVGRRTAVAVGDLADSGLMMRMTRGRAWIGVLAVLLAGIVALNVASLGLSASTTKIGTQSDSLDRQNSVLRTQLAKQLSDERVDQIAGGLGLSIPQPGEIGYLRSGDQYAAIAARRLASGELSAGDTTQAPPVLAGAPTSSPTASAPTATTPAPSAPAAPTSGTTPTLASPQPTAAPPSAGSGGGISAP
jgi:hypothetical protein